MSTLTRIENAHLSVDISSLGAELQAITTRDSRQWLWNGDPAWWTGRSPILFPVVGKSPDGKVSIDGETYDMAPHGFARRSEFTLAASTATTCQFELHESGATRAVYPFAFRLALTYALDGPTLTATAEVENRDSRPMPFGFGFHPAFVWPLPGADGRPHTITLGNGADPALVRIDGNGLVEPPRLPSPFDAGRLTLDSAMFQADAMIFPEGAGTALTYAAEDGPALSFRFDNLPNLALWQKPGAPYICIEPWHGMAAETGAPNDLAKRPYSVTLPAGEAARFSFSVDIGA
jgi:galactose mutarotase-like enzyme